MFVLFSRRSAPTARVIRDILGIRGNHRDNEQREDWLIRWGTHQRIRYVPNNILNRAAAIQNAVDKRGALLMMREHHVNTPRVFDPETALQLPADVFPLLGRNLQHRGGTDIHLCLQRSDVLRAIDDGTEFFTNYIPTNREFRVHVFQDEALKVSEKVLTEPANQLNTWIRNRNNGFTFRNVREIPDRVLAAVKNQAIAAVEALGLDFGAVDVILGDDTFPYVLEVNTAPGLEGDTLRRYVLKFADTLGIDRANLNWPDDMVDEALGEPEEVPEEELMEMLA